MTLVVKLAPAARVDTMTPSIFSPEADVIVPPSIASDAPLLPCEPSGSVAKPMTSAPASTAVTRMPWVRDMLPPSMSRELPPSGVHFPEVRNDLVDLCWLQPIAKCRHARGSVHDAPPYGFFV